MSDPKRVAIIGAGPAGLYAAILLRRSYPRLPVTVYEQGHPHVTAGWGVVLSSKTLRNLREADAVSFEALRTCMVEWEDLEVRRGKDRVRSGGHRFVGLGRAQLLERLTCAATDAGVEVRFGTPIVDPTALVDVDVVLVCDGPRSRARESLAAGFQPTVDIATHRYFWVGTAYRFRELAFIFERCDAGQFQVHAYPHSDSRSTLSFVVAQDTLERAGLIGSSQEETARFLETLFADHLHGHPILTQHAVWGRFRTVGCERWVHERYVLLGDAAHTAHFTIGSGTKMALEGAIALRDALVSEPDISSALARYELVHRPTVAALQSAAASNLNFIYHPERYVKLTAEQFAFRLVTRTGQLLRAEAARRDPRFIERLERSFSGGDAISASKVPFTLAGATVPGRILSLDDLHLAAPVEGVAAGKLTLTRGNVLPFRAAIVRRSDPSSVIDHLRGLKKTIDVVIVEAASDDVDGALFAERVRLALDLPVAAWFGRASIDLADTLLLGGRVDFVVVNQS